MEAFKAIGGALIGTVLTVIGLAGVATITQEPKDEQQLAKAVSQVGGATSTEIGLTICNQSKEDSSLAIGYPEGDTWITHGWYSLKRGECTKLNQNTSGKTFYYYAKGTRGGVWSGSYPLCIEPINAFAITGFKDCEARNYKTVNFLQAKGADGETSFTVNLTGGTLSKIDSLDIGDGVYIQGLLSDEFATIIKIDKSDNSIKVRRSEDGTTKWVKLSDIITREKAQSNDLKRTALGVGIVVCALSPESCNAK